MELLIWLKRKRDGVRVGFPLDRLKNGCLTIDTSIEKNEIKTYFLSNGTRISTAYPFIISEHNGMPPKETENLPAIDLPRELDNPSGVY